MRWIDMVRRGSGAALAMGSLLFMTGCAGSLGNVLGTLGGGGYLEGEVRHIDSGRRELVIEESRGRDQRVGYDSRTEVIYRQERYPVLALERGDVVRIDVREDSHGNPYALRIDVLRSVSEGGAGGYPGGGALQRFDGRVDWIEFDRGRFSFTDNYRRRFVVSLPYNASSNTVSRFRRLRQGERVRIEGEIIGNGRVELYRFY